MDDAQSSTPTTSESSPPPTSVPSSSGSQPTAAPPPRESAPSQSAPSPQAPSEPQGETHESLLDYVQKAVPEPRSSQQTTAPASGVSPAPATQSDAAATTEQPQTADDDLPDEVSPEELAAFHPDSRRRVKKLLDQRRDLRATLDKAGAELQAFRAQKPLTDAAASVQEYLRANDIGRDDFLLTLELAAAMRRGDFATFYQGIRPYMDLAEQYLGIQIPQDLQQRVQAGQMTTETARAFNKERMDRLLAQSAQIRQQQLHQAQQQSGATNQLANDVAATVNRWEQQTMQADPDYERKRAAVQNMMWSVVRETGAPQTPEQAVAIAQESYRRVNEQYRSWTAPKRPTSRQPSSTGRTNGAAPEPKNLLEAVQIARQTARV